MRRFREEIPGGAGVILLINHRILTSAAHQQLCQSIYPEILAPATADSGDNFPNFVPHHLHACQI